MLNLCDLWVCVQSFDQISIYLVQHHIYLPLLFGNTKPTKAALLHGIEEPNAN